MRQHIQVKTDTKAGGFWDSTKAWMSTTKDKAQAWWGTATDKAGDVWEDIGETWDKYF